MKTLVSRREKRTLSVHIEHELLLRLEQAGLSNELAQRVVESKGKELAKKIVELIQNRGFLPTTSQKCAREIMGENFFGFEDAIEHFKISPTDQQLAVLSEIPFSEPVLKELKDTHILIAVFPLSILEIRNRIERKLFFSHEDSWYNNQDFAKEQEEIGWQLICKTAVDNSFSKNWQEQQALLTENEKVPTAQSMVYAIIGHYLATGEQLFENTYVRTDSLASDGGRVDVGYFDSGGLYISSYWDSSRSGSLGLASSRKS